jgi:hypothetical protein
MELNLIKVDANAGRSGNWGNRGFRKGVHRTVVSQEDADKLVPLFERFYGAVPERAARAEHPALFAEGGPYHGDHPVLGSGNVRREGLEPSEGAPVYRVGDDAPASGPERKSAAAGGGHERAPEDGGPPAPGEERFLSLVDGIDEIAEDGSIELPVLEPEMVPVAQGVDVEQVDIDLAEAVGRLDPEEEAHWTPQGLPNLDALRDKAGRGVTRREVDAVATGYNRTLARRAKE